MKLLHIDSSILGGQSVSRQLTASIVAHLKQATPGLEITYRDLAVAPVPQQSPTIQFAKMKALYEAGALPGHVVEMVAAAVQGSATVDASTLAPPCTAAATISTTWPGSAPASYSAFILANWMVGDCCGTGATARSR